MIHPLPDAISRVRVAIRRRREFLSVLNSNFVKAVLLKLLEQGYITSFNILNFKKLLIFLKYIFGDTVITGIHNFYRPSALIYLRLFYIHAAVMKSSISFFLNFFFSTPFGILTDAECRMLKTGGCLLLSIN